MAEAVRQRVRPGGARRRGAAGAGVFELRHVRDYADRGRRFKDAELISEGEAVE